MAVASFAFISLNLSNLMDSFLVLYLLSTSTLAGTSHVFRVPQLIFLISTAFLPDLEYGWEAGVTLFFLQQWVHKLFGAPGKNKASLVAQRVKNLSVMQKTRVLSLGQEDPLEEGMATHASISIWRIPWTEEGWWATSQWGCKELDTTDFHFFFFFFISGRIYRNFCVLLTSSHIQAEENCKLIIPLFCKSGCILTEPLLSLHLLFELL